MDTSIITGAIDLISRDLTLTNAAGLTTTIRGNTLTCDGVEHHVWDVEPSPENTHQMVTCVAPPLPETEVVERSGTPDGAGGTTYAIAPLFAFRAFYVVFTSRLGSDSERSGLVSYRATFVYDKDEAELAVGTLLRHEGLLYVVAAVTTRQDNPSWGVAEVEMST